MLLGGIPLIAHNIDALMIVIILVSILPIIIGALRKRHVARKRREASAAPDERNRPRPGSRRPGGRRALTSMTVQQSRVPEPTASFWVIKVLTTGMGEALSDFLVTRFDPVPTVLITAVLFALILTAQLRTDRYRPWLYWGTVSMVGVFGTMVADVTHVALGVPYLVSTPVFPRSADRRVRRVAPVEATVDVHTITSTRRQLFYWSAVIATFAMGTAAGDLAASTLLLGYLGGGVLFVGLMVLVVLAGWVACSVRWQRSGRRTSSPPSRRVFRGLVAVSRIRGGLDVGLGW